MKVKDDVVGMRQWVGKIGDAELPASLEFAIPLDLVGHRGVHPLIVERLVLALSGRQHFGEQPLCPLLPFDGVDGNGADDRLCHRHLHLLVAVVDADGPIGLFQDDALEPLLVECG